MPDSVPSAIPDSFKTQETAGFLEKFWLNHQNTILHAGKQFLLIVLVLVLAWVFVRILDSFLRRLFAKTTRIDPAIERLTLKTTKFAIEFLALLIILDLCGVNTTGLLTMLGTAGLAVGLALKDTLKNLAAGIVLFSTHPFSIGDYIDCGPVSGTIESIGFFSTQLRTADGLFVFVPNGSLWGNPVTNYTRNKLRRADIAVGIDYADDLKKGVSVLTDLMKNDPRILSNPAPQVLVSELADSSVNLQLRFWVEGTNYWKVYWDVKEKLKPSLEDAGLNIPFPQRVLTFANFPVDNPSDANKIEINSK